MKEIEHDKSRQDLEGQLDEDYYLDADFDESILEEDQTDWEDDLELDEDAFWEKQGRPRDDEDTFADGTGGDRREGAEQEAGEGPGRETGKETGSKAGEESGSKAGEETGSQAGEESGSKAREENGSRVREEPQGETRQDTEEEQARRESRGRSTEPVTKGVEKMDTQGAGSKKAGEIDLEMGAPKPDGKAGKTKGKGIKIACGTGLALLFAGAAFYVVKAQSYKDAFFPNTVINGQDAEGMTVEDVKDRIASALEGYEIRLLERKGQEHKITKDDIGLHTVFDGTLEQMMDVISESLLRAILVLVFEILAVIVADHRVLTVGEQFEIGFEAVGVDIAQLRFIDSAIVAEPRKETRLERFFVQLGSERICECVILVDIRIFIGLSFNHQIIAPEQDIGRHIETESIAVASLSEYLFIRLLERPERHVALHRGRQVLVAQGA